MTRPDYSVSLIKLDDPLIGAAAEAEVSVAKGLYVRAVYQDIKVWQYLTETGIRLYFLIGEAGIAPDSLVGLCLYAACKFSERLDLIEGISTRECYIGKLISLDNLQKLVYRHLISTLEVPGLRVMTSRAMVSTTSTINRGAETRAISHSLLQYIQYTYFRRVAHFLNYQQVTRREKAIT